MRRTNSIPAASELLGPPATPVSDELDLKTAQSEIAANWIEAYKKYVSKSPPTPMVRETKPVAATSTATFGMGKHALWQILETWFTLLRKNQAGRVHVGVGCA
jgi:hypothetical protein